MKPHEQLPGFESRVTAWLVRAKYTCNYSTVRVAWENMSAQVQFLHHWEGGGRQARGVVRLGLVRIPLELHGRGHFKRLLQMCCLLGGEAVVLTIVTTETEDFFNMLRRWAFVQIDQYTWGYFKADGGAWPLGTTTGLQGQVVYPPPNDWTHPRRKRRVTKPDPD